jgi:hypothetical protein
MPAIRRPAGPVDARRVTLIGQGQRLLDTVGLLVGSRLDVQVHTADRSLARILSPYPGVTVHDLAADYGPPETLPPPPYVVCLDDAGHLDRVRGWLPPVRSVFLLAGPRGRRLRPAGWLELLPPAEDARWMPCWRWPRAGPRPRS